VDPYCRRTEACVKSGLASEDNKIIETNKRVKLVSASRIQEASYRTEVGKHFIITALC
jgi:hypothetical protein